MRTKIRLLGVAAVVFAATALPLATANAALPDAAAAPVKVQQMKLWNGPYSSWWKCVAAGPSEGAAAAGAQCEYFPGIYPTIAAGHYYISY